MSDNLTPDNRALVDALRLLGRPTGLDAADRIVSLSDDLAAQTRENDILGAQVASIGHEANPGAVARWQSYPDDSEADQAIADSESFAEAIFELDFKYHIGLTNNSPRWSNGVFIRHIGDFIGDVEKISDRFRVAPERERADKATKLAALADKAIEDAPHKTGCEITGLWVLPEKGRFASQKSGKCTCWKADYTKAKGELNA